MTPAIEELEKLAKSWQQSYSMERRNDGDDLAALLSTADSDQRETALPMEYPSELRIAELEEKMKALDKYLRHYDTCLKAITWKNTGYDDTAPCDCGLDAALTRPAEQQEVWTKERHEADMQDLRDEAVDLLERYDELRTRLTAVVTERDDLRRKLEEQRTSLVASYENKVQDFARETLRSTKAEERAEKAELQLAASSLASAALRTALEWLVNLYHGMSKGGPDTSPPSDAEFEEAIKAGEAALALPADSLAQEVVTAIKDLGAYCAEYATPDDVARCDALLAKLGGPK